jgi:hypothetical protein
VDNAAPVGIIQDSIDGLLPRFVTACSKARQLLRIFKKTAYRVPAHGGPDGPKCPQSCIKNENINYTAISLLSDPLAEKLAKMLEPNRRVFASEAINQFSSFVNVLPFVLP